MGERRNRQFEMARVAAAVILSVVLALVNGWHGLPVFICPTPLMVGAIHGHPVLVREPDWPK
jgi:hypothetical protein